jgi:hypothetical protein
MTPVHRRTFAILAAWLLGGIVSLASTLLHAAPQNGWWWNPAEAGRGFFLEVQGPRMFMSGYFYGNDGRATWLVSNDPMPNSDSYDGRLLAFRDGQALVGDYRHPLAAVDAGAVSLRFTDDSHGTLTWPGGVIPIERYDFHHGPPAAFQPKTGWWWNPDESGRGFAIEMQGDHMFIGAYMYDGAGNPVWYVADALMQSANRFSGPLLQFANGQAMGAAYRAPTPPAVIGTITVDFSASNQATLTLTDDRPHSASKAGRTIIILPQYEMRPVLPTKAASRWVGSFNNGSFGALDDVVTQWHNEGQAITWERDEELITPGGGYPAFYKITHGFVVIDALSTSPDCIIKGATSIDLAGGDLTVKADGSYQGKVTREFSMKATATCRHGTTQTFDWTLPFNFSFSGNLAEGVMKDHQEANIDGVAISRSWDFAPRFD